jgi:hypothetical protein
MPQDRKRAGPMTAPPRSTTSTAKSKKGSPYFPPSFDVKPRPAEALVRAYLKPCRIEHQVDRARESCPDATLEERREARREALRRAGEAVRGGDRIELVLSSKGLLSRGERAFAKHLRRDVRRGLKPIIGQLKQLDGLVALVRNARLRLISELERMTDLDARTRRIQWYRGEIL